MLTKTHFLNRRILHWSLATSVTLTIIASLPAKTLAVTGFTGDYDPSNWTLTNTNADGSVDTNNAASGSIDLIGGDSGSESSGATDWVINITPSRAGSVSFDWSYFSLDVPGNDTGGYLLNNIFYQLAATDGDFSTAPVTFLLNPGDTFGFRVATVDNLGSPGIFTVQNFNVQPVAVPFQSSPVIGLAVLGLNGLYRQWRKRS